ncbi:MAG: TIGR02147 family protein [Pseudobdellovibrionaceae bacterium]
MNVQFVEDHRDYILREMRRRAHRRPFYSQRAMARDLKLAPSTLTDFLKGRMGLSPGRVQQISKILGLTQEQIHHWQDLISFQFSKKQEIKSMNLIRIRSRIESEKNSLTLEQFKTISEWQHLAVLELIEMNSSQYSQIQKTAKALGCSVPELKAVFLRLESQGLLKKDEVSGQWAVSSSTMVGNSKASEAIRKFHRDMLTQALLALEKQPMETRFFTSALVGLSTDQVQRIKETLEHLPNRIFDPYLAEKSQRPKEHLYCFSLQFFNMLHQKGS